MTGATRLLLGCEGVQRHLDAYVDGEVDPRTRIEFEEHLNVCADCREHELFVSAVKERVHQTVSETRAPESLRERIMVGLDEADAQTPDQRGWLTRALSGGVGSGMALRVGIPLSMAAGALVVVGVATVPGVLSDGSPAVEQLTGAMPVFEDVVRVHASGLPADVSGEKPDQIQPYFQNKVRFPVRPARFQPADARFVGARLSNVRERSAAALYYDVGGRRLTVVVFNNEGLDTSMAQRIRTEGREVFYHQVHGHTVPLRSRGQLTYAFAGDLDRHTLLRLAALAQVDQ